MGSLKRDENLVNKIKKSITGAETGTGTAAPEIFNENLPEGLTPDTVQSVSDYVTVYVASGMEAAGDVALDAMKSNKKLDVVNIALPMGAFGQADTTVHRSKEVTIPPAEKGGEATKEVQYGVNSCSVSFVAGKNSGLLGKARDHIKE